MRYNNTGHWGESSLAVCVRIHSLCCMIPHSCGDVVGWGIIIRLGGAGDRFGDICVCKLIRSTYSEVYISGAGSA